MEGKKKRTKGPSLKKCYLPNPGKLAQPICHLKKKKKNKGKVKLNTSKFQRTNRPHLIYLKNFTRESLKKTKGAVGHPNLTKS